GQVLLRMGNVLGVDAYVVEADMDDPQVRVAPMLALGGVPHAEPFQNMIARSRPVAAITGTFFGIRNLMPTGDLVIEGQLVWRGVMGTAIAITDDNQVSFIPTRYMENRDWSGYHTVVRAGPNLVANGNVAVAPAFEG